MLVRYVFEPFVPEARQAIPMRQHQGAHLASPDRGVVWSTWTATNQHGVPVCTVDGIGLYGRRPARERNSSHNYGV